MDQIPENIDSKFRFVLLAAERAEQLIGGARPKVEDVSGKVTHVAMEEVQQGLVAWEMTGQEEAAPAAGDEEE
jgi:DNA-directed RNA polymerase omega subunit